MHIEKKYLKFIQSLAQKKFRNKHNRFVLEGAKLIQEALDNNVSFDFIVYNKELIERRGYQSLIAAVKQQGVHVMWAHESELQKISHFTTSDGLLAVVDMFIDRGGEVNKGDNRNVETNQVVGVDHTILVFDQINDPGNLGTIIRTADWFDFKYIVLTQGSVDVYNPKVVRASMGSLFRVDIKQGVEVQDFLAEKSQEGYVIIGTSLLGDPLNSEFHNSLQNIDKKIIVFGNESHGLTNTIQEHCNKLVKIPGNTKAESLNLGVSAGIIMYEYSK